MERHLIEQRPTWWKLYAIMVVMLALVALVETSVAQEQSRIVLEIALVIAMFGLIMRWVRVNRARIELAEAAETRRTADETVVRNGQPATAQQPTLTVRWMRRAQPRGRRIV